MNIITLLGIFNAIFAVSLGVFIFFKTPRTKLSLVFLIFTLSLGIISFSQFHMRMSGSFNEAFFWSKIFGIWPIVAVLSVHFILMLNTKKQRPIIFFVLLYAPGIFLSYLQITTNLIALEPIQKEAGWVMQYNYNTYLTVALLFGIVYNIYSVTLSLIYSIRFEGNEKKQAILIFIGYTLNVFISIFSDFFAPYFKLDFPEVGSVADIIPLILIGYATWKYSLFQLHEGSLSSTLFSTINNHLLIVSSNKKIIEINQNLLNTLGYTKNDLLGKNLDYLVREAETMDNPLSKFKNQSNEFQEKNLIFKDNKGESHELVFSSSPIRLSGRTKPGYIYVGFDKKANFNNKVNTEKNKEQITLLAEAALDLVNLETKDKVFEYIAETIYNLLDKKAVVTCSEFIGEIDSNKWELKIIKGVSKYKMTVSKMLGFDFTKMSSSAEPDISSKLVNGKLKTLEFNLSKLTNGLISKSLGERIKSLIGLKDLHAIHSQFEDYTFGTTSIMTKKDTPAYNKELIESLLAIASTVLYRKNIEHKLAESETLFRSIVENSQISIFIIANNGELILAEGKQLQRIGLQPREIIGKTVNELSPNNNFIVKAVERALKGETFKVLIDVQTKYHYNVSFSPFIDTKGNQIGTLAMADDITSRIIAENKLAELSEMQTKLFSVIGHDLKGPIANVLGYSDLILNDFETLNNEEIKHFIKNIQKAGHNGSTILNDLIDWSKSVQLNAPIKQETICLRAKTLIATSQIQSLANKKQIEIINTIDKPLQIFADKNMLTTVLRNLLSNAVKFTRINGQIEISFTEDESHIAINILDNGIGISEERLKSLFDNEVKDPSRGTEGEVGSGLGLQICKEFVEKNNGELFVESQIDKGSTFTIKFPKIKKLKA